LHWPTDSQTEENIAEILNVILKDQELKGLEMNKIACTAPELLRQILQEKHDEALCKVGVAFTDCETNYKEERIQERSNGFLQRICRIMEEIRHYHTPEAKEVKDNDDDDNNGVNFLEILGISSTCGTVNNEVLFDYSPD
jgi:hypothetical protein